MSTSQEKKLPSNRTYTVDDIAATWYCKIHCIPLGELWRVQNNSHLQEVL